MKKFVALGLILFNTIVNAAPTATLTASPTTGVAPLSVTLTWSSTEAVSCAAPWTTNTSTSGSASVTVNATATYSITCSAADGSAIMKWVAPTQNTDGTPLLDLAGFKIFHSTTAAGLLTAVPVVINDKLAITHTITGLPAGSRLFSMKAFNVPGVESDMSPSTTSVITIPATSATASVTITTKPKPPTLITISPTVYNVVKKLDSFVLLPVGTVPLNIACNSDQFINGYNVVPRSAVTWTGSIRPNVVVAKCSAES